MQTSETTRCVESSLGWEMRVNTVNKVKREARAWYQETNIPREDTFHYREGVPASFRKNREWKKAQVLERQALHRFLSVKVWTAGCQISGQVNKCKPWTEI